MQPTQNAWGLQGTTFKVEGKEAKTQRPRTKGQRPRTKELVTTVWTKVSKQIYQRDNFPLSELLNLKKLVTIVLTCGENKSGIFG